MKPDILTVCILATTILASTRHVIGFLTSQTAAASPVVGPPSLAEQQSARRLSAMVGGGVGDIIGDRDEGAVIQQRRHLDALERNVYDPGDDLLHALNAELNALVLPPQESQPEPEAEPQPESEPDFTNAVYNELEVANKFELLKKMEEDLRAEQELVDKSALLMKMLEDPTLDTLPLVYVEVDETPPIPSLANDDYPELETGVQSLVLGQNKPKRSRYYRRYPWKRHNRNRGNYEPELRYACTPSKEDIFKLLVNLHENRKGNHSKTVNFCNRKRPAKAVFTNIRFLG